MSSQPLIIIGDGEFAEIAFEYFTHDSAYTVVAFAVEQAYLTKTQLFGLPVVAFETVEQLYPAPAHAAFVAVTFTQLNRVRTRLFREAKAKGYAMATYISSRAFVWHNATVGENCFIFEQNVIQHFARIGSNVILWSGNHIGHRSSVADNVFLSSHVVVSGYVTIGESCFAGVNATIGDRVSIARDVVIGAGAVVLKDVAEGQVMRGNPAVSAGVSSLRIFGVRDQK